MDSVTQMILGASVGYAVAGKQLGKKAILWGALAGTIPDLDIIPLKPFNDEFLFLKHHRGFSHSLIFALATPFLFWKKRSLFWLFFWGFATHILLDCFTSWGTQVFWPHPLRVAFNSVFIIDPLYTLPLLAGLIATIVSKTEQKARKWITIGLIVSSTYLLWGLGVKAYLNTKFEAAFTHHNLQVERYTNRPSPFNSILWSTVAETKDGYYYLMISLFDDAITEDIYFVEKNHHLITPYLTKKVDELLTYTKGYYTAEPTPDGILIHDLRYGYMGAPWLNGPNYVFSYHLTKNNAGQIQLEVQNPRPKNTMVLLKQLWDRI